MERVEVETHGAMVAIHTVRIAIREACIHFSLAVPISRSYIQSVCLVSTTEVEILLGVAERANGTKGGAANERQRSGSDGKHSFSSCAGESLGGGAGSSGVAGSFLGGQLLLVSPNIIWYGGCCVSGG